MLKRKAKVADKPALSVSPEVDVRGWRFPVKARRAAVQVPPARRQVSAIPSSRTRRRPTARRDVGRPLQTLETAARDF